MIVFPALAGGYQSKLNFYFFLESLFWEMAPTQMLAAPFGSSLDHAKLEIERFRV